MIGVLEGTEGILKKEFVKNDLFVAEIEFLVFQAHHVAFLFLVFSE
jgi:hypothetical protein